MRFFRRKPAAITAHDVLEQILEARPQATALAPKDCRGVYGLVDHHGDLRYIGSTKSAAETFYKRIHQRHRTGSEDIVVIGSEADERFAVLYSDDGEALTGALVVNWPRALIDARRGVASGARRSDVATRLSGNGMHPVAPAL